MTEFAACAVESFGRQIGPRRVRVAALEFATSAQLLFGFAGALPDAGNARGNTHQGAGAGAGLPMALSTSTSTTDAPTTTAGGTARSAASVATRLGRGSRRLNARRAWPPRRATTPVRRTTAPAAHARGAALAARPRTLSADCPR